MAPGSVTPSPAAPHQARVRPSWKLGTPHDVQTQGMLVSGFADLPYGRALFLEFAWPEGQGAPSPSQGAAWLQALQRCAPITDADGRDPRAAALAFSWTGLKRLGLPQTALESFSAPFCEGMFQEDRARRLGDRRLGRWLETVVTDGPVWSANTPMQPVPGAPAEEQNTTPITVHALLMLYEASEQAADDWVAQVRTVLDAHDVQVVHDLQLLLDVDKQSLISREHFGFADGVSQPEPYDAAVTVAGQPAPSDGCNSVPLGEFLIGHLNGHREKAPGPVTPDDPANPAVMALPPHADAEGFRDLGLNGSYLVVRQLSQDVAAFWTSMAKGAERLQALNPSTSGTIDADWMAERVVGRNTDGDLLRPSGSRLPKDAYGQCENEFRFLRDDPLGRGCPAGSHVRRANPRDALAPSMAMAQTLLDAANNHRILRRGRKYGPKLAKLDQDDGQSRGLLFMCLVTDIARQFEFVQQTWLLNENFATLSDETDPLVGPKGTMTLRDTPLRRIVEVETFIKLVGGDYFFLPSLPALQYLTSL